MYWSPLFVWLLAIFYYSGDAMSAANTGGFLDPVFRRVYPGISDVALYVAHVAARKSGHVLTYASLALLAFRAFRAGQPDGWRWSWVIGAFLLAVSFGAIDELRQSYVSTRTGSAGDVVIDMTGAAAALAALVWFRIRISRHEESPATS